MLIVLEGPDGSGKSTLARALSEAFGIPIRHSGGPGKYPGEIHTRVEQYLSDPGTYIYDRHPCVSNDIYVTLTGRDESELLNPTHYTRFYDSAPLIIYCRANDGALAAHRLSEFAGEEHHLRVVRSEKEIRDAYDGWALAAATLVYRIGDDVAPIFHAVQSRLKIADLREVLGQAYRPNLAQDLSDFHEKFGLRYGGLPRVLDRDLMKFRSDFIQEELDEFNGHASRALNLLTHQDLLNPGGRGSDITSELEGMLDALVDLVYVAIGTADLMGLDFNRAWRRVHKANMSKERASTTNVGKRGAPKFDVVKPPGWQAPNHTDLVRNHIHRRRA